MTTTTIARITTTPPSAAAPITMTDGEAAVRYTTLICSIMSSAEADQSGVSFSTSGSSAAWESSSTVL